MRFLILLSVFIHLVSTVKSQFLSRFDLFAGYGYYEDFNAGLEYHFNSRIQSVSFSAGYDNILRKDQEYFAFSLGYNTAVKRQLRLESEQFKWRFNNSIIYWQLDDKFYLWRAISLVPAVERNFDLIDKLRISVSLGPAFNIVLYSHRKTFMEVGWPYHVMPDLKVLIYI